MASKEGRPESPFKVVKLDDSDSETIVYLSNSEIGTFIKGLVAAGGFKIFETVEEERGVNTDH